MMQAPFAEDRGTGPAVVLLHGFGGHHGAWDACLELLGTPARTIAYDLPGHGASIGLRQFTSARKAASVLLADIAGRVSQPFHLVGHSMGGAVATLLAAASPDVIASLTLLAPGGFGETINEPLLAAFARATDAAELAGCLAAMSAPGFHPREASAAALADIRALPGQRELLVELCSVIARDGRQGVIPAAMLATIASPVTIVWGDRDSVLPAPRAEDLPAHFEMLRLPGAGHMLPDERPGEVAGLLRRRLLRG